MESMYHVFLLKAGEQQAFSHRWHLTAYDYIHCSANPYADKASVEILKQWAEKETKGEPVEGKEIVYNVLFKNNGKKDSWIRAILVVIRKPFR